MFPPIVVSGEWSVRSEKDPRFNKNGRGDVGGFVCPPEAKKWIAEQEKKLNIKAPDDLEFSYMKD